ncbi:MAG: hypothetical protein ACO24H_09265, partial [Polynucleobacter sp.]
IRKSISLSIVLSKKAALKPPFKLLKIDKNKKSAFLADSHTMGDSSHETESALDCLARAFYFSPLV